MNKKILIEIFGWYGSFAIIGAYFLNSFELVATTDVVYQLLNLTGAFGIIAVSYYKKVYQSVALNIVWSLIALFALAQLFI